MKYIVSEECIGCGLCAAACPEVFEMTSAGVARAADAAVAPHLDDAARQAQDACPVGAIESAQ